MNIFLTFFAISVITSQLTSGANSFAKPVLDVSSEANHLSHIAPQLNKNVLKLALAAYKKAVINGAVRKPILTVIDYSLPSSQQRMWIFDLNHARLLYHTYVA